MSPEEKPPKDSDPDSLADSFSDSQNATENQSVTASDISQSTSDEPVDATEVEPSTIDERDETAPVMAEMAGSASDVLTHGGDAAINATQFAVAPTPPIAGNLENMSANGGAIGSLVLGVWCVIGSFVTNWSIINGVIGLLMGFWGLTSRKQRTAWIGILLCVLGIFMSMIQVSELINTYMNAVDETPY